MVIEGGVLSMSALPGVNLTEASIDCAVALTAEALHLIHSVPTEGCPFVADWATRLHHAEDRVSCGLVDDRDFDQLNRGRSPADILSELQSQPPLALALRSMHDNFGSEAEQLLRKHVPHDSLDEALLRRFRLLDELF
jgi:aminoglycoside phosphotransferase